MNRVKFAYSIVLVLMLGTMPNDLFAAFDFNKNCLEAYKYIFQLKLNTARQLIAKEKSQNPHNAIVPLLENYVDYFYLLTTDSKDEFERLEKNKATRLDLIEDSDQESPYYLYAQAEINLQWAMIRSRYGAYFTAAREINRANKLLQENQRKFPSFQLNLKGIGLINGFLGNLPDGIMKSTLATFGLKGDMQKGLLMLEGLAENLPKSKYAPFYEEVVFYYSLMLNDIAHSPQAYAKTIKYTAKISDDSLLKTYLEASVSLKSAHNDQAIALLEQRPTGSAYTAFYYLDYLLGLAKLNKLDYTASTSFNRFLQHNTGVNYIKDANLRLAWIALLKEDGNAYKRYSSNVGSKGFEYHEKDKQAIKEAIDGAPDRILLKSRLLFDGGYYSQALGLIAKLGAMEFTAGRDRTEYHYRRGRINDSLGNDSSAIADYQNAINSGKALKYYYAANAALQLGKLYEGRKDFLKARQSYDTAIQMKNHDYESSIESQAKAGLNRIKNGK